jgi:hypothetical protein
MVANVSREYLGTVRIKPLPVKVKAGKRHCAKKKPWVGFILRPVPFRSRGGFTLANQRGEQRAKRKQVLKIRLGKAQASIRIRAGGFAGI